MQAQSTQKPDNHPDRLIQPNAENHYEVTSADLPLACPMPGMQLWNSHPRVYLPIRPGEKVMCPYCSATFELK